MLFATGARNATVGVPAGTTDLSRGVHAFILSLQASRQQAQQLSGENIVCGVNRLFLCFVFRSMFALTLMFRANASWLVTRISTGFVNSLATSKKNKTTPQ